MPYSIFSAALSACRRYHLEDLGVDGGIITKPVSKKRDERCGEDSSASGEGPVALKETG
jgi:hypothetical protein